MAIGKVGSFATVEPALVDFGSMAERNIDKIKAEEQAKAAAKAKEEQAKRDAIKDIKDPNIQKTVGIGAVDEGISKAMRGEFERFANYKSIGDADNAGRSARKMNIVAQQSEYLQKKMDEYQEAIKTGDDINPEAYRGVMNFLTNLDKDKVKISFEGDDPMISVMNEDGTYPEPSNLVNYVQNVLTPVRNYVEIDDIKKVTDVIKASTIESGNYFQNKKITDINSKESAPQVNELRRQAKLRTSLDESMFNWYNTQRAQNNKLPFKVSGWTEDEKKQAEEYYFNTFKDSYNKEVEMGFGSTGGGSGGAKEKFTYGVPVTLGSKGLRDGAVIKLASSPGGLKGRAVFYGSNEGVEMGGKKATHIYATTGDNPSFAFQILDPTNARFGGMSGKTPGWFWVKPKDADYSAFVTSAKSYFKVDDERVLGKILRGEKIEKEEQGNEFGI
jgi:hypothetical protein